MPAQAADTNENVLATNRCIPKGGIGIINHNRYIVLTSENNELLLGGEKKWTGLKATSPEIVVLVEDKVLALNALPKGFNLSKATVISFEGKKIRFMDFAAMSGGYYEREK